MPVKKVAFIAMPFGRKETISVGGSQAPGKVDFDELWNRAYYAALENSGYLPVRADIQDGSLIIKDDDQSIDAGRPCHRRYLHTECQCLL